MWTACIQALRALFCHRSNSINFAVLFLDGNFAVICEQASRRYTITESSAPPCTAVKISSRRIHRGARRLLTLTGRSAAPRRRQPRLAQQPASGPHSATARSDHPTLVASPGGRLTKTRNCTLLSNKKQNLSTPSAKKSIKMT